MSTVTRRKKKERKKKTDSILLKLKLNVNGFNMEWNEIRIGWDEHVLKRINEESNIIYIIYKFKFL